mmetsp:Transcript_37312/g.111756  ORF Transcript_37312/g.111756 Transcript_37312/m.111756 type:complete len:272 (-) Transcript_37312:544-1359(-)
MDLPCRFLRGTELLLERVDLPLQRRDLLRSIRLGLLQLFAKGLSGGPLLGPGRLGLPQPVLQVHTLPCRLGRVPLEFNGRLRGVRRELLAPRPERVRFLAENLVSFLERLHLLAEALVVLHGVLHPILRNPVLVLHRHELLPETCGVRLGALKLRGRIIGLSAAFSCHQALLLQPRLRLLQPPLQRSDRVVLLLELLVTPCRRTLQLGPGPVRLLLNGRQRLLVHPRQFRLPLPRLLAQGLLQPHHFALVCLPHPRQFRLLLLHQHVPFPL